MRTGFDLLHGLNGFLETFDLTKHLFKTLLISILLRNRKLLDYLVTQPFDS